MQIEGSTAEGFEAVRQLFEHEMQAMAEKSAQLCVYFRGQRVVDLWATDGEDAGFSPDSLVNVFSSGKSLEASVNHYNKALGSFQKQVLPGAARFTEMGIKTKKEVQSSEQIETTPRQSNKDPT